MEFTSVESTILEKAISDSGWQVTNISNNNEYYCTNSFFSESATIKKLDNGKFGLKFNRKLCSADFVNEASKLEKEGDSYIITSSSSWNATNLLKRAAELYSVLPDNPLAEYQKKLNKFSEDVIEKTEAERIVKERVGQDIYRDALMKYWQGACSVTGCTLKEALRASHAKPWADCESDAERLNVYNGFLLTANLDALFDKGYISFTDDGLIMISSVLDPSDKKGLGLSSDLKLRWLEDNHKKFLKYHRENIWKN